MEYKSEWLKEFDRRHAANKTAFEEKMRKIELDAKRDTERRVAAVGAEFDYWQGKIKRMLADADNLLADISRL